MLVSTTFPIPRQQIPARAQVAGIFATARNPYTGKPARVLVQAVRMCGLIEPVKMADVREFGAPCSFSTPAASLSHITAFCVQEVRE